jgi:hypothetical protein
MTETFLPYREASLIKDWQPREPRKTFPKELAAKIAWGEIPCPVCGSSDLQNCQEKQVLVSPSNPGKLHCKNHVSLHVLQDVYRRH